jgi:hypothetical protein
VSVHNRTQTRQNLKLPNLGDHPPLMTLLAPQSSIESHCSIQGGIEPPSWRFGLLQAIPGGWTVESIAVLMRIQYFRLHGRPNGRKTIPNGA